MQRKGQGSRVRNGKIRAYCRSPGWAARDRPLRRWPAYRCGCTMKRPSSDGRGIRRTRTPCRRCSPRQMPGALQQNCPQRQKKKTLCLKTKTRTLSFRPRRKSRFRSSLNLPLRMKRMRLRMLTRSRTSHWFPAGRWHRRRQRRTPQPTLPGNAMSGMSSWAQSIPWGVHPRCGGQKALSRAATL